MRKLQSVRGNIIVGTCALLFGLQIMPPAGFSASSLAENNISEKGGIILAETRRMDRRDDRRDDRGDRRDDRGDRRDTRQDCRQEEGLAGGDKRDCKQEGREERRSNDGSSD